MLDVRGLSSFADYFVICTAESDRQIKAIIDALDETLKKEANLNLRQEGEVGSGWVLLDGGDVLIHIFTPEQRSFYQLEQVWSKAVPVLRVQ